MLRLNGDTKHRVRFTLNGEAVSGWAEPRMLLSDFIRQELGETGTHVGCEHGVCGACTIRIDAVAVRSCLCLAVQADGRELQTVEGLAGPRQALGALQRAFKKHHALQCGFCTPGLLMSLTDLLERDPAATEEQIRDVVGGHLCRCTGYAGIMAAALEVAGTAQEHSAR